MITILYKWLERVQIVNRTCKGCHTATATEVIEVKRRIRLVQDVTKGVSNETIKFTLETIFKERT